MNYDSLDGFLDFLERSGNGSRDSFRLRDMFIHLRLHLLGDGEQLEVNFCKERKLSSAEYQELRTRVTRLFQQWNHHEKESKKKMRPSRWHATLARLMHWMLLLLATLVLVVLLSFWMSGKLAWTKRRSGVSFYEIAFVRQPNKEDMPAWR
jgi:hypothetical protein